MANPYILPVDIEVGPVTLTFQSPTRDDRKKWDAIADQESGDTFGPVSDLLWSLLVSTKIDGKPAADGWQEDLRESGLLHGPNGIEVGAKLFLFRTIKASVGGLV